MDTITINGTPCEFTPGQMILQVAHSHGIEIPHYCYHDGLSIVASCRICLAEVWAPNPRHDNQIEPIPKLLATCQTRAADGQHVYTNSPRAVANQKAVMEDLLINHPLDCPVCDQAGECDLQDYSYRYGRGVSRFQEEKIKQPKKDLGPNVLLYADRCIMCTRCVRFTREVTGTSELLVNGRGNREQIDIFPGRALDNPLASNVVDLCPVGALLDKDFLFKKRVWDLTSSPSIDGITSSGDNLWIDHADGRIHRVRPRVNLDVNLWWITDEVRFGWRHIHCEDRLAAPLRREHGALVQTEWRRAIGDAAAGISGAVAAGERLAVLVAPTLACEEAYLLARAARAFDDRATIGVGPIPVAGEDQAYPPGDDEPAVQCPRAPGPGLSKRKFIVRAEKCPNSRGVRRVLEAMTSGSGVAQLSELCEERPSSSKQHPLASCADFEQFISHLRDPSVGAVVLTGAFPSDWSTPELRDALSRRGLFVVLIDTLASPLVELADVALPSATWAEKSGVFENADGRLQAFEPAIAPIGMSRAEGQIALDLFARLSASAPDSEPGETRALYDAARVRQQMADECAALNIFATEVHTPPAGHLRQPDMQAVEL